MNHELNLYLKSLERGLSGLPRARRKAILSEMRGSIGSLLDEQPDAALSDIEAAFGKPEEVAISFMQGAYPRRAGLPVGWLLAILSLALAAVILCAVYVVDTYRYNHGYIHISAVQEGHSAPSEEAWAVY